jgi:hypothetical protein
VTRRGFLSLPAISCLAANARPLFEEISSRQSGIRWVHENAMSPNRYLPETLGPGCAFLDYDNDGWMDLYLVNSGPCDFFQPTKSLRNALYKNNRDGTFRDVTDLAGVPGGTFGMGVAVGDYNNDGYPDLLVTAYGRAILYRNNGNGTFTDVTEKAGLNLSGWTTSAVWFDCDNDGRLDLFVCSFVEFGLDKRHRCDDLDSGKPHYCIPRIFKPTASFLYRNNGNGTFTEVGRDTEIGGSLGKALGVVATDINNDGWMDLFVANDTEPDFLFVNRGAGRWEEAGLVAEVALGSDGQPRSGMGVDAADFDGDGWEDLFVANIDHEVFSLYQNHRDELFFDVSFGHDLAQASVYLSGWGAKFFDYDNDGSPDLMVVNGYPDDMIEAETPRVKYREPFLLFQQQAGKLRNVSAGAGPVFTKSFAARGLAIGDYNNDGRLDALVGVNGGAPLLLRNNCTTGNHWVGLKLEGVDCNRDAIGARITWSAGGVQRSRLKNSGGSYLSSHDPREVLGLGTATKLDWIEIRWPQPSGRVERITGAPVDRYLRVVEGKGVVG